MHLLASVALALTILSFSARLCYAEAGTPVPPDAQATPPIDGAAAAKPAEAATKANVAPVVRAKERAPIATCPPPKMPVYVSDWERLAEITRSDSLLSEQADSLARRNQTVRDVSVGGVVLGGAVAFLGAVHAMANDEWSRFDSATLTTGIGVTALSLFISWLSDHNRDEFYTLINQWNLRHPDQWLAP